MKTGFLLFFILFSIPLLAQEDIKDLDIRFGVGKTILGSGDMLTLAFENEINYRVNPYFTTALSVGYGRSNLGVFETASYVQGNLNGFVSPFKNTRRNDFRIGGGLSWYNVSDYAWLGASYGPGGEILEEEYEFDIRSSYGYSFILENTFALSDKYLLGLKLFTQPYFNGDINSGLFLKFGVKL